MWNMSQVKLPKPEKLSSIPKNVCFYFNSVSVVKVNMNTSDIPGGSAVFLPCYLDSK